MREPGDFEDRLMPLELTKLRVLFTDIAGNLWAEECEPNNTPLTYKGYRLLEPSVIMLSHADYCRFRLNAYMDHSPVYPNDAMTVHADYNPNDDINPGKCITALARYMVATLTHFIDLAYDNPGKLPMTEYSVDRGEVEP